MTTVDTHSIRADLIEQAQPREARTIHELLVRMEPELAKVLPATITPERFARIVTTELRRTPALLECSPESVLGCLMLTAQLGLEPGPLGHVYLVPYKRECTFIVGYKGFVDLGYRSGLLRSIVARTVYAGDGFEYQEGTSPKLTHKPAEPAERGDPKCWYAVAHLTTGGKPFHVLYPEDVEARRKRSASGRDGKGPWSTDYDAMARKSCIRALAAVLPVSAPLAVALQSDDVPGTGAAGFAAVSGDEPEALDGEATETTTEGVQ